MSDISPPVKKVRGRGLRCIRLLKHHAELITTIAIVVQTIIAGFMIRSLSQGQKALEISQHQLESTIEPNLEWTYRMSGGGHASNNCNRATVVFTNAGITSISDVTITHQLSVVFDEVNFVTKKNSPEDIARGLGIMSAETTSPHLAATAFWGASPHIGSLCITNCLPARSSIAFDFNGLIEKTFSFPDHSWWVSCFFIKYKRTVDQSPRIKYIFFLRQADAFMESTTPMDDAGMNQSDNK